MHRFSLFPNIAIQVSLGCISFSNRLSTRNVPRSITPDEIRSRQNECRGFIFSFPLFFCISFSFSPFFSFFLFFSFPPLTASTASSLFFDWLATHQRGKKLTSRVTWKPNFLLQAQEKCAFSYRSTVSNSHDICAASVLGFRENISRTRHLPTHGLDIYAIIRRHSPLPTKGSKDKTVILRPYIQHSPSCFLHLQPTIPTLDQEGIISFKKEVPPITHIQRENSRT